MEFTATEVLSRSLPGSRMCSLCHCPGHYRSTCRESRGPPPTTARRALHCSPCGHPGHNRRSCRESIPSPQPAAYSAMGDSPLVDEALVAPLPPPNSQPDSTSVIGCSFSKKPVSFTTLNVCGMNQAGQFALLYKSLDGNRAAVCSQIQPLGDLIREMRLRCAGHAARRSPEDLIFQVMEDDQRGLTTPKRVGGQRRTWVTTILLDLGLDTMRGHPRWDRICKLASSRDKWKRTCTDSAPIGSF